jgi:hypothetical protein
VTVVPALNTPFPIEVTVFARLIEEIDALLSVPFVTVVTPCGTFADPVQAVLPLTTLLEIVKNPLVPQFTFPDTCTFAGADQGQFEEEAIVPLKVMLVRSTFPRNAVLPTEVTFAGIVIDVNFVD